MTSITPYWRIFLLSLQFRQQKEKGNIVNETSFLMIIFEIGMSSIPTYQSFYSMSFYVFMGMIVVNFNFFKFLSSQIHIVCDHISFKIFIINHARNRNKKILFVKDQEIIVPVTPFYFVKSDKII